MQRSLRVSLISGVSSGDVLDEARYEAARQLLTLAERSVDIAATLGYASASPFVRSFKRWSGHPPGHWRRESAAASTA